MITIETIGEIVIRQVRSKPRLGTVNTRLRQDPYPDNMISSSNPYSFICCKPHPSFIRLGIYFFLHPVKFGV